jgi:hypothetical protein
MFDPFFTLEFSIELFAPVAVDFHITTNRKARARSG